jgi:hypothetical protein
MQKKRLPPSALSMLPRDKLEQQAMLMRKKARNADLIRSKGKRRLVALVLGAGAAYGTGFVIGRRMAQGLPVQYSGADLELIVGGVGALLGVGLQAKSTKMAEFGEYVEAMSLGVLSYYAGSRGESHGQNSIAA